MGPGAFGRIEGLLKEKIASVRSTPPPPPVCAPTKEPGASADRVPMRPHDVRMPLTAPLRAPVEKLGDLEYVGKVGETGRLQTEEVVGVSEIRADPPRESGYAAAFSQPGKDWDGLSGVEIGVAEALEMLER